MNKDDVKEVTLVFRDGSHFLTSYNNLIKIMQSEDDMVMLGESMKWDGSMVNKKHLLFSFPVKKDEVELLNKM